MGSPLILIGVPILLGIVVVLSGAGAFLALLAVALVAFLAAIGVLSVSTLVGLLTRSVSNAFQVLFLSFTIIGGMFAGVALAFLAKMFFDLSASAAMTTLVGAATGLIGGLSAGLLFNVCWTYLLRMLLKKKNSAFPALTNPGRGRAELLP